MPPKPKQPAVPAAIELAAGTLIAPGPGRAAVVERASVNGQASGSSARIRKGQATEPTPRQEKAPAERGNKLGGRRPGRPAGVDSGMLDRATILSVSLQLTKTVPLSELSVVRVARELGVTPGLIHYYLGGRDRLTSGVMNAFYREAIESWPGEEIDWRQNLEVVANAVYRSYLRYPGIVVYVASHNRYRLVQDVGEGETDYGIQFFERFTTAVRGVGFDALRTAAYAHLLADIITSYAHATAARRWPSQHSQFLNEKLAGLDPAQFPSTHFIRESLTGLNPSDAFKMGLALVLQALEVDRSCARFLAENTEIEALTPPPN